jgi:hypothetical protein
VAWLWNDDNEYTTNVQPAGNNCHSPVRRTHRESWFALQAHLHEAVSKLRTAAQELQALKLHDHPSNPAAAQSAHPLAEDVVYY